MGSFVLSFNCMLKKFLPPPPPIHLPFFIVGTILILLGGIIALFFVLYPQNMVGSFLQSLPMQFGEGRIVTSGSSLEILRIENNLQLRFVIDEKDQGKAEVLSDKLGVTNEWMKGISLAVDEETLNKLAEHLPLRSSITFKDSSILLTGSAFSLLQSGLPKEGVELATRSGRMQVVRENNNYGIKIEKPADLLVDATESGKLNLSKKISSELFQISEKISTIDLKLEGKSLEGEIKVK